MKAKEGFVIRKMGTQSVVVSVGAASKIFNGMIKLNETSELLWHYLIEGTTKEELVQVLLYKYEVDEERAKADVEGFVKTLLDAGIIEA